MVSKEEILQEKELYWKSVLFFAAFSKHLQKKGVSHKIEHKVMGMDGNPKYPDFLLFEEGNVIGILEHKASLPVKEDFAIKTVDETNSKYSKIKYDEKEFQPPLILLCPKTCEEVIEKIKKNNSTGVLISTFNLDEENCVLNFSLNGEAYPEHIRSILSEEIPCRNDDFSKYKFIRKEPHPVYTAWIIWSIVLSRFKDPYTIKKDSIKVRYENLVDEASTLFPSWIEDVEQITKARINKALIFLNKIGFVNWKSGESEIEFLHNRGSRVGEIFDYFAKNWIKAQKLKPEMDESKKQSSLEKFMKY